MITRTTEWEGQQVRLVSLGALPGPAPAGTHTRVTGVSVHQTGGTYHRGLEGVAELVKHWAARPARFPDARPSGGGYGRPTPYHFVVPGPTQGDAGKLEVYRLAGDLAAHANSTYPLVRVPAGHVSIGVCGCYTSRHAQEARQPDALTWLALEELAGYLLVRYGLKPRALTGGFECGSPADPGDQLEQWIRYKRGFSADPRTSPASWSRYTPAWPDDHYQRDLPPARLAGLLSGWGYQVGDSPGRWSDELTAALRAFQANAGLPATGLLDVQTEGAIRAAAGRLA